MRHWCAHTYLDDANTSLVPIIMRCMHACPFMPKKQWHCLYRFITLKGQKTKYIDILKIFDYLKHTLEIN